MKKLGKFLLIAIVVIALLSIMVLLSPFIVIAIIYQRFNDNKFNKQYQQFLADNHGKNFFCYNNRADAKDYIETHILPTLAEDIEVVYINGLQVESTTNPKFIGKALRQLQHYQRFPHLMKIRNGQLVDKSINNSFYNVLNLGKSKAELIDSINTFFSQRIDTEIENETKNLPG